MCGRFCQNEKLATVVAEFDGEPSPDLLDQPTWNAAPGQQHVVVTACGAGQTVARANWGMAVSWGQGRPLINARIETAASKPTFREAYAQRRCLVPATGFYEWNGKQPTLFRPDRQLVGFAALWWPAGSQQPARFVILTTTADSVVAPVHDRMPMTFRDRALELAWLHGEALPDGLNTGVKWRAQVANPAVNKVSANGPALWDQPPEQTSLF